MLVVRAVAGRVHDRASASDVAGGVERAVDRDSAHQIDLTGLHADLGRRDLKLRATDLDGDCAGRQLDGVAVGLPVVDQAAAIIEAPDLDVVAVVGLGRA